jgi:cation transport regulator ChaC
MTRQEHECWYFAYGSNLNRAIFVDRRGMTPSTMEIGCLKDYTLRFDQPGIPFFEPAFANVEAVAGECVWGVLWKLPEAQMRLLDVQEGGGDAYDRLPVTVEGERSGPVQARTYVARRTLRGLRPSRRYMNLIEEGGRRAGLPVSYMDCLAAIPTTDGPLRRRVSPYMMRFAEKLFMRGIDFKKLVNWYWDRYEKRLGS